MHIKFQLIRLFYFFIWWCEITEGFIDSPLMSKFRTFFSDAIGLTIFILLGCALSLCVKTHHKFSFGRGIGLRAMATWEAGYVQQSWLISADNTDAANIMTQCNRV